MSTYPQIVLGTISCETDDQKTMINAGYDMLDKVLADPRFKVAFLAFPFVQTNGMSNQDLWDLACAQSPITMNCDLHDMGFKYDRIYHTVGLDDASDPNTCYMNSYIVDSPYMVADNLLHETWHRLGLSHINPTDSTSVPYGNNTLFEQIAALMGFTDPDEE